MKKTLLFIGLLMMMLFTAACSDQKDETKAKEGDSKKSDEVSGEMHFYTSQPEEDAQALVDAFNKKYPDVTVNVFRSGTEEVMNKIQAENKAGDIQADVLLVADAVTFESLKKDDLLLNYKSDEAASIPEEFVDSDGAYAGTKVMATALIVNKKKVEKPEASWKVLTDGKSKEESIMPSPLYSGAAAYNLGVFTRNADFGWDFYEKLNQNGTAVVQGNGAVLKSVAGGEKSYGMIVDFLAARAEKDGSPVELIYPEEGVPVITEPIGILKNTKQEKAAKLFVDFVLSEEGQNLAAEIGYTPIRKGIKAPDGLKSIEEIKVLEAPVKELFENRDQDKEEFGKLFKAS